MASKRPNPEAMSPEQAIAELRRGAGSQFDPDLVAPLIELLNEPDERPREAAPTAQPRRDLLAHDRHRLEAQLDYQADHDLLTGLLNRPRFTGELERVLRYASRYRRPGARFSNDSDNPKLVNNLNRHAEGDAELQRRAKPKPTRG